MDIFTIAVIESLFSINENINYIVYESTSFIYHSFVMFLGFFSLYLPYKGLCIVFQKNDKKPGIFLRIVIAALFLVAGSFIYQIYKTTNNNHNFYNSIKRIDDTIYLQNDYEQKEPIAIHKKDIVHISIHEATNFQEENKETQRILMESINKSCIIYITIKNEDLTTQKIALYSDDKKMNFLNLGSCDKKKQKH